jgi:hypothetical protein
VFLFLFPLVQKRGRRQIYMTISLPHTCTFPRKFAIFDLINTAFAASLSPVFPRLTISLNICNFMHQIPSRCLQEVVLESVNNLSYGPI